MGNKKYLEELINESELSKSELKKIVYPLLADKYDIMKVKPMVDDLLKGNIGVISDEDAIELIQLLGGQVQELQNEIKEIIQDKEVKEVVEDIDEVVKLRNMYNTTLVENTKLETKLKKKNEVIEQLQKQQKEMFDKLNKFERIIERLPKYNIKERAEFIEVEDDEIDELYNNYLTEGITKLHNTILFEFENQIIIPKLYYKIKNK